MACEMIDRGLDQRLAIGPRDQRAWADRQLDRPEGAGAGDIGDGLMGEAAREERGKSGRGGMGEMTEQKLFARESEQRGRASCRDREGKYGEILVGGVSNKK